MTGRYYRELENIHVNCEEPRAYYIPFEAERNIDENRENSAYFTNLNGEWDFGFFPNVEELEIEDENFTRTVNCNDKMKVPFCWQLKTDRGYDVPNYINQDYPYPVDPPYLPDVIPCGFYRRTKNISKKAGKKYYINFDGVSSCFYLWINGVFKGYSQVSHCTSEFDITSLLKDGENLFEVLVVKHCTGSYMEDQDFFRLSGIFRDVYILERDEKHIGDIYINPVVGEDFCSAKINVNAEFDGKLNWKLISPAGEVKSGESGNNFFIDIENPVLWNCEAPELYTLVINAGEEYISFPVGLKRAEIKNGTFLFNGVKVKIRGINRHDMTPETGYYVPEEEMLRDLYSLKRANVNAIRTSHYPNDPRFTYFCDKLGFMVIDEADLESHGMGYNYGDWYWDYWAYLCDAPEWTASCIDRIKRLFERDKNRACVIMWSLGNESGCGNNHRLMANYIRSRNPQAIIHYENAHLEYSARLNKDFSDISDVESRMYASLEYLGNYLADEKLTKPFFYCEYVSAWSTGDIPLHWGEFEKNDRYMGGCIWEYKDHSVNIGTKLAPKYRYGGDFGDKPNDGIYCVDGLVYPDRTPRPGYEDMKQTYKPFYAEYENGVLTIGSKLFFTPLKNLDFGWSFEENGRVIKSGDIGELRLAPGEEIKISLAAPASEGNLTLNIYAYLTGDALYASKGYEVGFSQFILKKAALIPQKGTGKELNVKESRTEITVETENAKYTFGKNTGMLISVYTDRELLSAPADISIYRAYLPNCSNHSEWERARYNEAKTKCYSCRLVSADKEKAVINASCSLAAAAMPPALKSELVYTVEADGKLGIEINTKVTQRAPVLPRFGLKFIMAKGNEKLKYLGYGEREAYADRYASSRFSLYETTADESFEHYVRPTECSSHYGTVYAGVYNEENRGLEFFSHSENGICFSAKHYPDEMLMNTMHDDELNREDCLYVALDYRINAENCSNRELCPERIFEEKEFGFGFTVIPV